MRIILTCTCLLLFTGLFYPAFGQQFAPKKEYLIDSLILEKLSDDDKSLLDSALFLFHQTELDSVKIKSLGIICQYMVNEMWEKYQMVQFALIEKALTDNNKRNILFYKLAKSAALNNIGYIFDNRGEIDKALEYYEESVNLKIEIADTAGLPFTLNNIGTIFESQGNIPKALEYYYRSLKIQQKLGDLKGVASSFNNIGIIYDIQKDYNSSKDYHEKALATYEKINDKQGMSISLNNLGFIFYTEGNVSKGLSYYNKSLQLKEDLGDKKGIVSCLNNIGNIYMQSGNTSDALKYHLRSLELAESIGQKELLSNTLLCIADVMMIENKLNEAEIYAKKSYIIAKELGFPQLINNAAKTLSLCYKNKKLFKEALTYSEIYILYRDSINNEVNQKEAVRSQTKYEFEKEQLLKEQELKEKNRKLKEETERRDNLQYSIILIVVLSIFMIFPLIGGRIPLLRGVRGVSISPKLLEGLIFFAFLILFEFLLVLSDPYVDRLTGGEPMYKLLMNAVLAAAIFPLHSFLEQFLKRKLIANK